MGGFLGKKYKLPAGALTGALLAVVACNLLTSKMYFPSTLRPYVQIASGAFVGSRIKKQDMKGISKLIGPAILLMVGMFLMNILLGGLLYYTTDLDIASALYGTAPGGMQDMGLISQDFGADPVLVSVVQLVRLIFVLTCFPLFYRVISKRKQQSNGAEGKENICELPLDQVIVSQSTNQKEVVSNQTLLLSNKDKAIRLVFTLVLATIGGMLFRWLGISGGALTGAMIFVASFGILTEKTFFPPTVRTFIQIFAGAYIGAQMNASSLVTIRTLLFPLIGLCAGLAIFTYLMAVLLSKCSKFDMLSCMLMSTPGGLSEMTLLADEFDCNVPRIVVVHTLRVMVVISLFPTLLAEVMKFFVR
jgi:hypothetical protein